MKNNQKLAAALTVIAALSMSCASAPAPAPAPASPLSTQAEEPAAPPTAASLTGDPLAEPPPPSSSSQGGSAPGHAGHSAPAAENGAKPAVATYTCPMHPEVRETKQGRCPKCGMSLVPAAENKAPSPAPPAQPSHDGHVH
jgi:Heavy metal binding domain